MTDDKHRPPEPPPAPSQEGSAGGDRDENAIRQRVEPAPDGSGGPRAPRPNMNDAREFRTAQNFILAASIIGPVSLILASLLFSAIGIVCGYIGFRKLKALEAKHTEISMAAGRMKRSAIFAMAACGVTAALNLVLVWMLFPTFMDMVESGDYGGMLPGGSTGAETNSTWG